MSTIKFLVILVAICLLMTPVVSKQAWKTAQIDYPWSFPEDHWARQGYKTEWWYFTGHLTASDGRRFGYQFTFFRVGVLNAKSDTESEWGVRNLVMGHASISDLKQREHRFSEVLYRAMPMLGGFGTYPESTIAWSRGPAGTDGTWHLKWNGNAFDFDMQDDAQKMAFSLSTQPIKPLIFQGPKGYSRKDKNAASASQYYSFTRLQTTGQVQLDGKSWDVMGESWMDKEFSSNQLASHQVGWDWFSLQLDDQRDIMLYVLRHQNGTIDFARGTIVKPNGTSKYLGQNDFTVTGQARWKSPHTTGDYPSEWRISIPQEHLEIEVAAMMADQENRSRLMATMHYWEGAVKVLQQGQSIGKGYVELTGYGTSSRPAL